MTWQIACQPENALSRHASICPAATLLGNERYTFLSATSVQEDRFESHGQYTLYKFATECITKRAFQHWNWSLAYDTDLHSNGIITTLWAEIPSCIA